MKDLITSKRKYLFILTALLAVLLSIPSALSYFTTYTRAEAEKKLALFEKVTIWETGG